LDPVDSSSGLSRADVVLVSATEGLRVPKQSSLAIASGAILDQLEPLAVQLRLLWPAGVALVIALGVVANTRGPMSQRVWLVFFALGTALPATLALVLAIDRQAWTSRR
jgi:hypothetical protein